jgi:hypothetical protein
VGNEGKNCWGYWRLIFGARFVCICIVALLDDLYLASLVMKFKLDTIIFSPLPLDLQILFGCKKTLKN